jgi:dimethylhistidine N-methyltransferase
MTIAPPQRFSLIALKASTRVEPFGLDVAAGLTSTPKRLPCRYFYDREGSLLFEAICELPEYYLPRAEREILRARGAQLVSLLPGEVTLAELGSGNAAKTRLVIEALLARQASLCYVPVDICRSVLEDSARQLLADYARLEIIAVAGEYHEGLRHLKPAGARARLILWLGSNVGNFDRAEAGQFLRSVRETMAPSDRMLVGIDLRKDAAVLERAYDDAQGVTARFNLNLLARVNRELGGHFDLGQFRHRAVYAVEVGRVEMYLVSMRAQRVAMDQLGLQVELAEGETIHTENSYKYSTAEIMALAAAAGLRLERQWFDRERRFSLNLLAAGGAARET